MTFIAWLLALPVSILLLVFVVEVAAGLRPSRPCERGSQQGRAAIVIPAHDEATGIGRTVRQLRDAAAAPIRIVVIADNCSDPTAERAREAGAEVIVRTDPSHRGKGFALAFARDWLASTPPDVVLVIDADCRMDGPSLTNLVAAAVCADRPVQAINLLQPDLKAGAMVQVSNFAFMIKNLIRQRGLRRLSGLVHLTGTGMAFPWRLFRDAPLATDDVVEDLGLGLDLAARGDKPVLVQDATVWSGASTTAGTLKQRTRWEGGFLATSARRGLPAMASAIRKLDGPALWAALSLMVPPLALLMLIGLTVGVATLALALLGASPAPFAITTVSILLAGIVLVAAWARYGRDFLSPAAAITMPFYLIWKLPLYLGLLRRRPRTWLRTGREQP